MKIVGRRSRARSRWSAGGGGSGIGAFFKYTAGDSLASWTTSRASSATYYDVNGVVQTATTNTMRDGHYLGGVRHWLLEPARTNSALRSEDLTNAAWTKTLCTIGGSVTTPDGAAANVTSGIIGNVGTLAGIIVNAAAYTWTLSTNQAYSIFAKPGNKSNFFIKTTDKALAVATSWVNISTGTIGTTAGTHTLKMWPLTNGWYRIELRLSSSGTPATGGQLVAFGPSDADNSLTVTGDGATVSAYAWGMQMEQDQHWPSSYIATAAASVTRSGDSATRPHSSTPQSRTLYLSQTEMGISLLAFGSDYISIGTAEAANSLTITHSSASLGPAVALTNNGTASAATAGALPNVGDQVETRATDDGALHAVRGQSLNGGGETTNTSGVAAGAFQAGYTGANYVITIQGPMAIRSFKDILGVATLAQCRSA